MSYFSGSVLPVPTANKQKYIDHARAAWPFMRGYGALRMVENWGVDVRDGKVTDFNRAVQAKDDESVVFSWIEWPDRATADAAWEKMQTDPALAEMPEMPFDGMRMILGGFAPLFTEGAERGGYYQGFVTPVPAGNKDAYAALAREAWDQMFRPNGCTGSHECWGEDVPHGKQTDFHRAVNATGDEAIVFSWTVWPDRATCDAAAKAMDDAMKDQPMPEMPFDGKRMIWAGFEPIFDSAEERA